MEEERPKSKSHYTLKKSLTVLKEKEETYQLKLSMSHFKEAVLSIKCLILIQC